MPPKPQRSPAGEILTALTMELFRVSSLILNAGDRLAAHLGLTGTRWQILGAIVRAGPPQTVAGIARNLGTNRQNVQRIVNDLHDLEFLTFETNPRHRRAQLVVLTAKGIQVYEAAMELQAPWVNHVTDDLDINDLEAFQRVLLALREKLARKIEDTHLSSPDIATTISSTRTKSRTPTQNVGPRLSEAESGE